MIPRRYQQGWEQLIYAEDAEVVLCRPRSAAPSLAGTFWGSFKHPHILRTSRGPRAKYLQVMRSSALRAAPVKRSPEEGPAISCTGALPASRCPGVHVMTSRSRACVQLASLELLVVGRTIFGRHVRTRRHLLRRRAIFSI